MTIKTGINTSINTSLRVDRYRRSDYPIDAQFMQRWSPRAYNDARVLKTDLLTIFEAARWAPSAYNVQPWRFLYSVRDDAFWQQYLSLLDPFNASWAQRAGALVFLISDTLVSSFDPPRHFPTHSFDAGAAWIHIALQAQKLGYHVHAMGGIYHNEIRTTLRIPERYKIEIGIAIGVLGSIDVLPNDLREREQPSTRLPLADLVFAGSFRHSKSTEDSTP